MSKEDVEEIAQAILDRFFNTGARVKKADWDFLVGKLTPLVEQKEQKEWNHQKNCCRGGAHAPLRCYCPCTCVPQTPTPTVKEESHTQDGARINGKSSAILLEFITRCKIGEKVVYALPQGNIYSPKALEDLIRRVREEETTAEAFEAGRLQGIAEAVAVVPKKGEEYPKKEIERYSSWNACRQAMLTALSALTHKK